MPRVNRRDILADAEVQVFHVVNRCVRRTHLCGRDPLSRKDYSHRREWIRQRLEFLAGVFAVEILSYAVMSNHLHVVVRTRPDVAESWSDDEIARRWWNLFPKRKGGVEGVAEPTVEELQQIRNSTGGVKEKRRRLSNLSWFMKCLCEPIAKRANHDDEVRGHFWESRYKAQPLLDEMAIAACMAYVDLNPVRAGIAESPETSNFTGVQARIQDRQLNRGEHSDDGHKARLEDGRHAGWLSPVELAKVEEKSPEKQTARRASSKGCLGMTLDQYLQLLDWTGRQWRPGKSGVISPALQPILERLDCTVESWLDLVSNFRRRFRTEAGRQEALVGVSALRRRCRSGSRSC
jgi:REP element-mobilizing transposase RayT